MSTIRFSEEIPIRKTVEVLVVGGGPAGFAAAIAARRAGKQVFLVEEQGSFGGLGTVGLVPCYMTFTDGVNFLAAGIGSEIWERLQRGRKDPTADRNAIPPELLKRIYDDMAQEAKLDFVFFSKLIGVQKRENRVTTAIFSGKSGLFAVRANVMIDCTGDGILSVMAGASYEKGDADGQMMPATLCSFWAGLDWNRIDRSQQTGRLEQAFADHLFTVEDRHLTGLSHAGKSYGGGNIGHAYAVDGTDEQSLTAAMVEQRTRLLEYERYYREYQDGCEDAEIVGTGNILGVRETRRIVCDYQLVEADFVRRAVFEDEIGRNAYPVDIHPKTTDPEAMRQFEKEHYAQYHYAKGESYGIPYRSLIVKGFDNLLTAGRCIWTDQKMQSSIRIMPTCYLTGQAAGTAAALAAGHGDLRAISPKQLQKKLLELGAYLPNANL
jgi:hypothetical protein